jgi:hypothetical protein
MMRLLIATLFITLLWACNIKKGDTINDDQKAARDLAAKDSTTVEVIDTVFNFGSVVDGMEVTKSFRFKNTGTKPLIISDASASCGCTKPTFSQKPVRPGEIGYIDVKFDSKGRVGIAEKTINVTANVKPAFPIMQLKGEVTAKDGGSGHSKDDGHGH